MTTRLNPALELDLHLRSYGREHWGDRHAFAQLVLPVDGEVLLDIEDRRARLDPLHGALIAPGAWHAQSSQAENHSLIVDVDAAAFDAGPWQALLERPFAPLAPAARKLVDFMGILARQSQVSGALVQGWVPLLLDTLVLGETRPVSRLSALLARIEAEPGLPWSTAAMAQAAHVSVSRLHVLFRDELDTSPHDWLLRCRLERAREWLAGGNRSVAEIALAAGFADQSSLTRAMRKAFDTTPAAYRRAMRLSVRAT
jgi:AraC-like DNA-binding protein